MNELKVFTLEEASRLLPFLTDLIHELQKKRDRVSELEVEIDACELVRDRTSDTAGEELNKLVDKYRQRVSEFYAVVDQIHSQGCFLKDADIGLIDFYGVVGGRVVYFCWRLGEHEVGFWHEIGQGYANREPIGT